MGSQLAMSGQAKVPGDLRAEEKKYPEFPWHLPQEFAGIVGNTQRIWKQDFSGTDFYIYSSPVPNLSFSYDGITNWNGESLKSARLAGTGASQDLELARLKAIAEAAERYATSILVEGEYVFASAAELGSAVIDTQALELCSAAEEVTGGAIARFDRHQPIRWVKGWCLISGAEKFVPAVMTHLFPRPQQNEVFWIPISTGVAAHTDYRQAIVAAIAEVIERDAIALNWLTKRRLPRIERSEFQDETARAHHAEALRSDTEYHFFDATTDIGLPTVYTIETNTSDPLLTNVVACNSSFSWEAAIAGCIRELASSRYAFRLCSDPLPQRPESCVNLEDGARFMAVAERREIFDWLKASPTIAKMEAYDPLRSLSLEEQLEFLVKQVSAHSNDLVLVDLTTDDLRDHGLAVVRAVIPGLVPMSTVYQYRFLGHPRLLDFARSHVDPEFGTQDINPLPQPFA